MINRINEAEEKLKMDNVKTMVTTIVSLRGGGPAAESDDILLSEKLLDACNQDKGLD